MTVKELIKTLLEYDMNAEITGINGEKLEKIDFLSTKTCNDICFRFEKVNYKHPKIIEANACYTGGGIYRYTAKLADGKYLVGDSEWDCFVLCDADPNVTEDSWYGEWFDKHEIAEIVGQNYRDYLEEWLQWIQKHEPQGNYALDELERYVEEELK